MNGYFGKFLKVDLTTRQIEEISISEEELKNYIGGSTLAARLIYPIVKLGMDPLSPENPIIFSCGPFTGSNVPMVSRAAVCGISPATGLWGEATTGGKFPVRLKGTGDEFWKKLDMNTMHMKIGTCAERWRPKHKL